MNNLLFKFLHLLGAEGGNTDLSKDSWLQNILNPIQEIIGSIIVPILIIVATVGIIYSIVLGVNYAKAESSEDKENAKKRIINVVVGALLMIVLMLLLYLFIAYADEIIEWVEGFGGAEDGGKLFW